MPHLTPTTALCLSAQVPCPTNGVRKDDNDEDLSNWCASQVWPWGNDIQAQPDRQRPCSSQTESVLSAHPKMGTGSESSRCLSPFWDGHLVTTPLAYAVTQSRQRTLRLSCRY